MFQFHYDIFEVQWLELHPVVLEQMNSGVSVCICVCVYASTHKAVLSILFSNILPDDSCFCDCHNTLDRLLQGIVYNDAIILFLDHVCTWRPWSPENKVGFFSCGHEVQLSLPSVNVPFPLTQLYEIFSMFILTRLVFQLPENLDVIYKFEISFYWCLNHFCKMISKTGPHIDS